MACFDNKSPPKFSLDSPQAPSAEGGLFLLGHSQSVVENLSICLVEDASRD